VYHIEIDPEETVWVATGDGLLSYNGNEWNQYTNTNSGLPTSGVNHIVVNAAQEKWISTAGGIAVFGIESDPTDTKNIRRDVFVSGYPNPFSSELTISSSPQITTDFTILNMNGQHVLSGSFKEKGTINTRGLKPGMYVIRTKSALGTGVVKCLKM